MSSLIPIILITAILSNTYSSATEPSIPRYYYQFIDVYVEVVDIDDSTYVDSSDLILTLKVIGNYKDTSGEIVLRDNYRFDAEFHVDDLAQAFSFKKGDILKIGVDFSNKDLENGIISSIESSSLPVTTLLYNHSKNIMVTLTILMIMLLIFLMHYFIERRREKRNYKR